MSYVSSDGQILQHKPWSVGRVVDLFWGTINFFTFFVRSMFHLDDAPTRGQYGNRAPVPRRGMGGVGRVSGVSAPPACMPGGG